MRLTNRSHSTRNRFLAGLLAGCIATPALAQSGENQSDNQRSQAQRQSDRWDESDRWQEDRSGGYQDPSYHSRDSAQSSQERRNSNQQSRSSDQRQRQQDRQQQDRQRQGQDSQTRVTVQPEGWVKMAVDYNNDGVYDGVETIYIYDLRVAQERSRTRRSQQQGDQQQGQRQQRMQRQDGQSRMAQRGQRSSQQSATMRISGEIGNLEKIDMRDADGKFVIARVRTDEGRTARVLLGKEEQLSQLNLEEGDNVEVQGRRGRINDRGVLVANRVRSGDQEIQVQIERMNKPLRQFRGEVLQTRTTRFRNHEGEFVIAQFETSDGDRKTVNMGPKSKFSDMDLANAEQVAILATAGKINGQDALIAEEVSVDGETVRVKPEQRREQQWSNSGRSRSSQSARSDRDSSSSRNR